MDDSAHQLLARFGFGLYLGHPGGIHGEVLAYYDHRRDGLVGGLSLGKSREGAVGHAGIQGHLTLWGPWGIQLGLAYGSAVVARLGLRYALVVGQ